MTTKRLIEISRSALHDILCEGCGDEYKGEEQYGTCEECRGHVAKEIVEKLKRLDDTRTMSLMFDTGGDTPEDIAYADIDVPAYLYGWKPVAYRWKG